VEKLVINLLAVGFFGLGFYIAFYVFNLPIMWAMYGGAGLGLSPVIIYVFFFYRK